MDADWDEVRCDSFTCSKQARTSNFKRTRGAWAGAALHYPAMVYFGLRLQMNYPLSLPRLCFAGHRPYFPVAIVHSVTDGAML
jgi:hypothetical protein